jgi:hypothetical protein
LDYLRHGDLNLDGLNEGDIRALKRDMDYFQIPFPEISNSASSSSAPTSASSIFKIIKTSSNATLSGNVFSSTGSYATIVCESSPAVTFWEVTVLACGYSGHIRVGILNSSHNFERCLGQNSASVSFSSGNCVEGIFTKNYEESNKWKQGDKIGVLFDKKNGAIYFYTNGTLCAHFSGISNPSDWNGGFFVCGKENILKLNENPVVPTLQ